MEAQPVQFPESNEHARHSEHICNSDHLERGWIASSTPEHEPPPRLRAIYGRILILLWFVFSFAAARSAATEAHGQSMVIRLVTPLASYSPPGTRFDAKVIGPVLRDGFDFLPSGTIVTGEVIKSASVRFGVLRERAKLELKFDGCRLPDGTALECKVSLQGVDNAREKVSDNRIAGVLVASHMYSWLNGAWYRPGTLLLSRSAYGLTGAAGEIYMHLAPTPLGATAVLASELLLYRMPDPEIEFPAGTDLLVRVQVPDDFAPSPEQFVPLPPELSEWVAKQPEDVYLPDKRLAGDMIHLVFVGSREQVEGAFRAAGWSAVQQRTPRSFAQMYSAFLAMKADPTAPIAPLVYRGKTAEVSFQKTLNTVAKRHHIRIWPASYPGPEGQLWLAAATHDTTITMNERHMSLTHRIDRFVDRERSTVVNDLSSAGCVAGIGSVERPQAIRRPDSGKPSVTDGNVALLFLDDCSTPKPAGLELSEPQRRWLTLALRRFFLGDRQYLWRDNPYYWAYRATWAVCSRKPRNEDGID